MWTVTVKRLLYIQSDDLDKNSEKRQIHWNNKCIKITCPTYHTMFIQICPCITWRSFAVKQTHKRSLGVEWVSIKSSINCQIQDSWAKLTWNICGKRSALGKRSMSGFWSFFYDRSRQEVDLLGDNPVYFWFEMSFKSNKILQYNRIVARKTSITVVFSKQQ